MGGGEERAGPRWATHLFLLHHSYRDTGCGRRTESASLPRAEIMEAAPSHQRSPLCSYDVPGVGVDLPSWLFVTKTGTPSNPANVRSAMQNVLKNAKLPLHFTPHCLLHTYASIVLADGVSPVFVQEQLDHAMIELTVSTYGRWLKKKAPGALDRLVSVAVPENGSKVVAEADFAVGALGPPSGSPLHSST